MIFHYFNGTVSDDRSEQFAASDYKFESRRTYRAGTTALRLFFGLYHSHEPVLDRVRGFRRTQTQRECFVQPIAFGNVIFGFFSKFLSSFLELLNFVGVEGADHVKARLILELLKVHLSSLSVRHIFS